MPHTFAVDNVKTCTDKLEHTTATTSWCNLLQTSDKKIQASSANTILVPSICQNVPHQLVRAIHLAYDEHYPLSLSPDHIWTCIVQQLAYHVNANAEKLKSKFVNFQGKQDLILEVPVTPNWANVVNDFAGLIKPFIGEQTHAMVVANFSTTGPTERICSEIIMMDALKQYFAYECRTRCGIPSITIEGTPEDWEEIRQRAAGLAKYDLQFWLNHLLPILDEFVLAAHGKPNVAFWQKIYKVSNRSGGPYVSGWITDLFLYVTVQKNTKLNVNLGFYKIIEGTKMHSTPFYPTSFSGTINQCPAKWNKLGNMIDFKFAAGFVGVTQNTCCESCSIVL